MEMVLRLVQLSSLHTENALAIELLGISHLVVGAHVDFRRSSFDMRTFDVMGMFHCCRRPFYAVDCILPLELG